MLPPLVSCVRASLAPGNDEAPDPAEGLDPKVVGIHTGCTQRTGGEKGTALQHICFSVTYAQSPPAPAPTPVLSTKIQLILKQSQNMFIQ